MRISGALASASLGLSGVVAVLIVLISASEAADRKGIRFWNLTAETQAEVSLAPAGSGQFGPNQCVNDKDGTVDVDEQLRITGVTAGRYDMRLRDTKGRQCFVRDVMVPAAGVFSVQDKDLRDCSR